MSRLTQHTSKRSPTTETYGRLLPFANLSMLHALSRAQCLRRHNRCSHLVSYCRHVTSIFCVKNDLLPATGMSLQHPSAAIASRHTICPLHRLRALAIRQRLIFHLTVYCWSHSLVATCTTASQAQPMFGARIATR